MSAVGFFAYSISKCLLNDSVAASRLGPFQSSPCSLHSSVLLPSVSLGLVSSVKVNLVSETQSLASCLVQSRYPRGLLNVVISEQPEVGEVVPEQDCRAWRFTKPPHFTGMKTKTLRTARGS